MDSRSRRTGGFCACLVHHGGRAISTGGFLAIWIALIFTAAQAAETTLTIGYLELDKDPRYKQERMDARFQGQPWGRPFVGAQVALKEARFVGSAIGVRFQLERVTGRDAVELASQVERLAEQGVHLFLLDVPADVLSQLADRFSGRDVLLFNLSVLDNSLRQTGCQANLLHIVPSQSMLVDALTQYLITQKWRRVLVLQGPRPQDKVLAGAFQRAQKRFGLKVVDVRPFKLGRDPRQRSRNNIALLTSGEDYDVVFVADSDGEFARAVPYQIQKPRPVVGSAGLVPDWWHWAWERHGAPQLNKRFYKKAKRWMTGYDWAAWMAVKIIVEAVQRAKTTDFRTLADFIRSKDIVLDGFKGYRLNFRPWNNQLRQPLLVTTTNWVVERAPLEGFLHQTNNLDTLGFDDRESKCKM
ncbi:MAG: ABC transporter substrate-binding protein [Gammaproteobacteria bacterium]|nr:ABC transporter substrate-binding protein [Gammaproteobacteria bacterium]